MEHTASTEPQAAIQPQRSESKLNGALALREMGLHPFPLGSPLDELTDKLIQRFGSEEEARRHLKRGRIEIERFLLPCGMERPRDIGDPDEIGIGFHLHPAHLGPDPPERDIDRGLVPGRDERKFGRQKLAPLVTPGSVAVAAEEHHAVGLALEVPAAGRALGREELNLPGAV